MLELIYTSAPETLDGPGYGVVAKSENIPSELEKFMRKLCRYDFLTKRLDAVGTNYPNLVSHVIFHQGAET